MSGKYKGIERDIASFLHRYPKLKRQVKKAYQRLNYLFYKKSISFVCSYPIKKISFGREESFFGYYDKSPMSKNGNYLIFHSSTFPTSNTPEADKSLNIILLNVKNNKFYKIGETNAWNWQQGSRLQWIDNNRFVFNDFDRSKNAYIARIFNVKKNDFENNLDFPVNDVFSEISLSLNYDRLTLLTPDYGYFASPVKDYKKLPPLSDDGIYKTIISKNETKILYNFEAIIKAHYNDLMEQAQHQVNHILISPNGTKFMFIHRWFNKSVKYHGLMIAGSDGSSLKCLIDNVMISHCFWKGNEKIICYMEYEGKAGYHQIDLNTNKISPLNIKGLEAIGDGHPSICSELMVFDSYPDKRRMKDLYLFDLQTEKLEKVGEFLEPPKYYEDTRCDLHPCWNYYGTQLFINSAHEGQRFLYQIDLTQKG
jgi:hypothetical protein